jgi:hypothetical protein
MALTVKKREFADAALAGKSNKDAAIAAAREGEFLTNSEHVLMRLGFPADRMSQSKTRLTSPES